MSADSLATSTAVSTDMPTSAAFMARTSLMPSPMNPTTWPWVLQRLDDLLLLVGCQAGEHVGLDDLLREGRLVERGKLRPGDRAS